MIAIIDYDAGNLNSVQKAFQFLGKEAVITRDPEVIRSASHVVLPGVGAFADAAEKLRNSGLDNVIRDAVAKGKEIMGICLGMQLLFEKSYEYGEHVGLGLLKGEVVPIKEYINEDLKIPHIGWNALIFKNRSKLFKYIKDGDYVYFVHSYFAVNCADSVSATTEYGSELTAAVHKNNIMGCQFHPEKSGNVGLNMLKAFCEEVEKK